MLSAGAARIPKFFLGELPHPVRREPPRLRDSAVLVPRVHCKRTAVNGKPQTASSQNRSGALSAGAAPIPKTRGESTACQTRTLMTRLLRLRPATVRRRRRLGRRSANCRTSVRPRCPLVRSRSIRRTGQRHEDLPRSGDRFPTRMCHQFLVDPHMEATGLSQFGASARGGKQLPHSVAHHRTAVSQRDRAAPAGTW